MQKQKGNVKKSIILIGKEVKDGIIGNKNQQKKIEKVINSIKDVNKIQYITGKNIHIIDTYTVK